MVGALKSAKSLGGKLGASPKTAKGFINKKLSMKGINPNRNLKAKATGTVQPKGLYAGPGWERLNG